MADDDATQQEQHEETVAAGSFRVWLAAAVDPAQPDQDVPCGTCTACCRSSYFIHVRPEEADTRRHIPKALLFPAPGRPKGHHLMGYDERGRCPMLRDSESDAARTGDIGCSIYDHRPQTCRTFDCRVFAAAGVDPDEDGKGDIAERVRRWRFDDVATDPQARRELDAVRRAAAYLATHRAEVFPARAIDDAGARGLKAPSTAGQLADLAVRAHRAFLGRADDAEPTPDEVRRELG
jgi:Fe-S-cluster containining protein